MARAYDWKDAPDGNEQEVHVFVPVEEGVKPKDVEVRILKTSLRVGLKGQVPIIDAALAKACDVEECHWQLETKDEQKFIVVVLVKIPRNSALKNKKWEAWEQVLQEELPKVDCTITDRCFLEVSVDGEPAGRIVVGLYGNQVPKTAANFLALCTGEKGMGANSRPLHFKNSSFYRVVPGLVMEAGDIIRGDGSGGESIFGETFPDEGFAIPHSKAGVLSMANFGADTNSSRFMITLKAYVQCNGKNVAFGEVLEGLEDVIKQRIEAVGHSSGIPTKEVLITDCGVLES